jgi:hypothetical protein
MKPTSLFALFSSFLGWQFVFHNAPPPVSPWMVTIYEWIYAIGQSRSDYLSIIVYFQVLEFVTCCHILSVCVYLLSVLHYLLPYPLNGKYLFKLSKWLTYLNFLATCDWIYAVGQSRLDYLSTTIYFEALKFLTCCKVLNTFAYFLRVSHCLLTCPLHVRYLFKMSKWLTYLNCLATCETYYAID